MSLYSTVMDAREVVILITGAHKVKSRVYILTCTNKTFRQLL